MRKIREILRLKHEVGLPLRSIARAVHASIGTVSEYLSKAKEVGVSWPLPAEVDDEQLGRVVEEAVQDVEYYAALGRVAVDCRLLEVGRGPGLCGGGNPSTPGRGGWSGPSCRREAEAPFSRRISMSRSSASVRVGVFWRGIGFGLSTLRN